MRVYYIDEGAGYRNSLGISLVPFNPVKNERRPKLIFPTVSKPAHPGSSHILLTQQLDRTPTDPLKTGDFVDIPNVERGDMLDFFLISNGANGGGTVLWNDPQENSYKIRHIVALVSPTHHRDIWSYRYLRTNVFQTVRFTRCIRRRSTRSPTLSDFCRRHCTLPTNDARTTH